MHTATILVDIGLAIVAATVLAYVARLLRQPLLRADIGAGLPAAMAAAVFAASTGRRRSLLQSSLVLLRETEAGAETIRGIREVVAWPTDGRLLCSAWGGSARRLRAS